MKIFIGGSKNIRTLPEAAKARLDQLIGQKADILVGDCYGADAFMQEYLHQQGYGAVTVYASDGDARNNIGGWPVRAVEAPSKNIHPYPHYYAKDMAMAEDADSGFMLWDGKSKGTFVNIANLALRDKAAEICPASGGENRTVRTLAELREVLPPPRGSRVLPHETLPRSDYLELLREFIPSAEMATHLAEDPVSKSTVIDIILGAPVALTKKEAALCRLACTDDLLHSVLDDVSDPRNAWQDKDAGLSCCFIHDRLFSMHQAEIRRALEALQLKPGELLYMTEAWYDDDIRDENTYGAAPFLSFDAALRYLRQTMQEEEWDEASTCWTILEKWVPGENGRMDNPYTYYLIRDEVVYFTKNHLCSDDLFWLPDTRRYSTGNYGLNLPIPFAPGDIVTLDCRPFAPVKHVALLEVGDDCCGVQMLYRDDEGLWHTAALKHHHGWGHYHPMLSPLYRLSSCRDRIPPEERLLVTVRDYICGDAEKGRRMWQDMDDLHEDGLSEEAVRGLIPACTEHHFVAENGVLLEYVRDGRAFPILFSDILPFWPYATERDFEGGTAHAYGELLLFSMRTAGGQGGVLVAWDTTRKKVVHVSEGAYCVDFVLCEGKIFMLCEVSNFTMPAHLELYKVDFGTMDAEQEGTRIYCDNPRRVDTLNGARLSKAMHGLYVSIGDNGYRYVSDIAHAGEQRPAEKFRWLYEALADDSGGIAPKRKRVLNWLT